MAGQSLGERHFDEDDRLAGERRLKEGKATPVGFQTAAQVGPAVDFVDRFVLDELFQRQRRGVPANPFQAQKSAVEPGTEQVFQVRVHHAELGMRVEVAQQIAAQGNQGIGSGGRGVDAPEQFLPRRFGGRLQRRRRGRAWTVPVGLDGALDGVAVGAEIQRQHLEKSELLRAVHRPVLFEDALRQHGLRRLTALRQQLRAQHPHVGAARAAQVAQEGGQELRHVFWTAMQPAVS